MVTGCRSSDGAAYMNTLYPGRRSLGQRIVDTTLAWIAAAIFIVPAWLLDREARKAADR